MIVAAAALEAGVVNADHGFFCGGSLELGDGRFHCWRRGGHGTMNLHDAIMQSCDVYFYEVSRRVGIDRIAEMAKRLGVGVELGVALPRKRRGLIMRRTCDEMSTGK